ncbi:SR protein-specific kinase Dsk1 [Aspergillus steynii IBT 23096]|uniref:non-specific serine/threonine protein kinase n=1 Tax=Aspergillus steynii IBT 23096 TaxID=1392250 RepID=A0A2I2GHZ8_9EURO|nr:SR protein-specific kinase Dsk1 [Aspergillus steynii IBT 23096]PLB52501.1 SR protein-specific kinase Dsk1 [Aspergillus steynii IBT 23096]
MEDIYHPEVDVECLEDYVPGEYHPTLIGDTFSWVWGYSTIWLARDQQRRRYVSLKIMAARASPDSHEGEVLKYLMKNDLSHAGKRFIPPLLDQFSFHGPNGHHRCLVGEPAGCSISKSKEDSTNFMFPPDAARSTAAQLLLGLSYLHANGICQGDIHLRNFLLRMPNFDDLSTAELYKRFGELYEVPIRRVDGNPGAPHAPPHAIYPMAVSMPANELYNPEIITSDYGTSFIVSQTASPTLHTPALYSPPEDFFNEPIIHPTAADVWTLGVNLYEVLGERPLFETFTWDRDDIIAEMINTLGQPPSRWWNSWAKRSEFFNEDGSWVADFRRISTPVFRRLPQRLWDMGRGETGQTCEWDVKGGELRALEDLLRAMMAFEPAERPTADQILKSEYMVKWALPAWERQKGQHSPSR